VAKRSRKPPARSRYVLRWLAVGAVVLVGLLYARPLRSYIDTKRDLARRAADVRALKAERRELQHRLAESATAESLLRQARVLGYVRPGERLFVIPKEDIEAWLRGKATILRGGR
jgi:cell division protein FtsB